MIPKGHRLRATTLLGFVFIGLSAVSLAAVGLFSAARLRRELRYGVESSSRLLCAALAHELSTYLSQHAAALELAAAVGDASLDALRELYPAVERAFVLDGRGVLVAPRSSPEYGFDLSSTEFFRQGYSAQRYYVSSSFVQDGQYEPTVAIYKALPDGMNAVAYLNLGAIGRYVAELPTNGRGAVAVLGRRGIYIAHPDAAYIGQRRSRPGSPAASYRGSSGTRATGAASSSAGTRFRTSRAGRWCIGCRSTHSRRPSAASYRQSPSWLWPSSRRRPPSAASCSMPPGATWSDCS